MLVKKVSDLWSAGLLHVYSGAAKITNKCNNKTDENYITNT